MSMKAPLPLPLTLDRDDRRALATVGSYLLMALCVEVTLVGLTLTLALCIRIFLWAV